MSDFASNYFGPLDIHHCFYFLVISIIFFILLLLALFSQMFWVFNNYKQLNFKIFAGAIVMLFNLFLAYFVNRLLYTMCNKSFN
jgi:hypothetical protein